MNASELSRKINEIIHQISTGEGWQEYDRKLMDRLKEWLNLVNKKISELGLLPDKDGYEFNAINIDNALNELAETVTRLSNKRDTPEANETENNPYQPLAGNITKLGESFNRQMNEAFFKRKRRISYAKGVLFSALLIGAVAGIVAVAIVFVTPALAILPLLLSGILGMVSIIGSVSAVASLYFIPTGWYEMVRDYRQLRTKSKRCDSIANRANAVAALAQTAVTYSDPHSVERIRQGVIEVDREDKTKKILEELRLTSEELAAIRVLLQEKESSVNKRDQKLEKLLSKIYGSTPGRRAEDKPSADTVTLDRLDSLAVNPVFKIDPEDFSLAKALVVLRDEHKQMSATLDVLIEKQERLQAKLKNLSSDNYVNAKFEKYRQNQKPEPLKPKSQDRFASRLLSGTRYSPQGLDMKKLSLMSFSLFTPYSKKITQALTEMAMNHQLMSEQNRDQVMRSFNKKQP